MNGGAIHVAARSPISTASSLEEHVKFAIFNVPFALEHAAGRESFKDVIDWGVQTAAWADEYGLDEVFYAEHHTLGVEAIPAPELMIAAAAQVTSRVRLGALGHLIPYHHPVALAHRMILLDHMTEGRYIAGVAPGAYPTDAQLFDTGRSNAEMMQEGLDIIEAVLHRPGPWRMEGKYWNADMPAYNQHFAGPHLKPFHPSGPERLMTGIHPESPTLREAGRRGYSPVSQAVHSSILRTHWETYRSAAEAAGHEPSRRRWRITRDWLVADTDEQARELALNGALGAILGYCLTTFNELGIAEFMSGPGVDPSDVTVEWLIDNFALVGSPDTVAQKVRDLYEEVGGFGVLVGPGHARLPDPEVFRRSWELTGSKVAPMLADLLGD
jgi:alkanesulfonate monooxygenase SsuD/methylene tetrahydromethanopterin reductase-like flavin-dependent oxidoreductase (luciferase family)